MTSPLIALPLARAEYIAPASKLTLGENLMTVTRSNQATAGAETHAGQGAFCDLLTDNPVPIAGARSKAQFIAGRAKPLQARFTTPNTPRRLRIWADDEETIVRWRAWTTACDRPYVDSKAYFVAINGERSEAPSVLLGMRALDDDRSRCSSTAPRKELSQ